MASITERETEKYDTLHCVAPAYVTNSPGELFLKKFLAMSGAIGGTVLDAGTCSGKGALALKGAGFDVAACDLTDSGLVPEFRASCIYYTNRSICDSLAQVAYLARACDLRGARSPFNGQTFDYVYGCDVLEHIPPAQTMLAIRQLLDVSTKGVFLSISLRHDMFGVAIGRPLHHTVRDFAWWRHFIDGVGHIKECIPIGTVGLFFVEPRK